ncbi:unnamed protein product [Rotaria magnacalcarata]|nr:unnamed protein product [Rotaria magnacalcarata]
MPVSRTAIQQTPRSTTYHLHEFDPSSYDWDDWELLCDTYIDIEGITDDTKKRNLLITALSVQPFKTLISICKPKKPNECSFQEILQKFRTNYTRVTFCLLRESSSLQRDKNHHKILRISLMVFVITL